MGAFKRVAVLPLENYTSDKYANEIIRSKIIIELLSRGMDVIEPGEVVVTLKELKVRSLDALRVEDIKNMGGMLNVDAVVVGSVERFGISKGISVSYPEVSVHLMLFESATGSIAWSVWHTTGGASFWTRHFGAEGATLDKTSAQVIKEAFDTLFNKMPVYAKPHSTEIIEEKGTALSERKIIQQKKKIREVPSEKHSEKGEDNMVGKPIKVRMAEPAEKPGHINANTPSPVTEEYIGQPAREIKTGMTEGPLQNIKEQKGVIPVSSEEVMPVKKVGNKEAASSKDVLVNPVSGEAPAIEEQHISMEINTIGGALANAEIAMPVEKIEEPSAGEVSRKTEGEIIAPVAGENIAPVEKTRFTE